ncbi:MAG: 8-oxo-dGTP diphosphatase [Oscillospiraceae bacterium]|nr:8-oxo-dGTP diphosphatase [Oscillospiraceae bacterium]
MARTEIVTITNMCMVCDGDRILVQDKKDDDSWNGATFPGGHVEKGEPFTDAVIREVFEETGLTIRSPRLCGIKDWIREDGSRYMVLLYKTDSFSGELRSSEEGEVFWVKMSEFSKLKLATDMDILLRVFCEDELSEFFYNNDNGKWEIKLK